MSLKAVIFDLDGVLIDSEPIYFRALSEYFSSIGFTYDKKEAAKYAGRTLKAIAQKAKDMHPNVIPSASEIEENLIRLSSSAFLPPPEDLTLIDGVSDWIRAFCKSGIKTAVASSGTSAVVNTIVRHFGLDDFFGAVVSGNDTKEPKPSPEIFLLAARRLNISPSDCLVIEDSENGIIAAKKASMLCYCFSGTNHYPIDFSLADYVFPHYDSVVLNKILSFR